MKRTSKAFLAINCYFDEGSLFVCRKFVFTLFITPSIPQTKIVQLKLWKINSPVYFTDTTLAARSSPRFTPSIWRWLSMLSQFTTLFGSAKKPNYPISVTWRWSSNQNAIFEAIINSFILKTRRFKNNNPTPKKILILTPNKKEEIGLQIYWTNIWVSRGWKNKQFVILNLQKNFLKYFLMCMLSHF